MQDAARQVSAGRASNVPADRAASKAGTLYLAHVLTHASRAKLDDKLAGLGITAFHYTVLSVIGGHDGLSSSALSRRFHVTPQAMGEVILLLEQRELLERREDATNRRVLHLSLTRKGQSVVQRAGLAVTAFERTIFAGVSRTELATLRRVLQSALAVLRDLP